MATPAEHTRTAGAYAARQSCVCDACTISRRRPPAAAARRHSAPPLLQRPDGGFYLCHVAGASSRGAWPYDLAPRCPSPNVPASLRNPPPPPFTPVTHTPRPARGLPRSMTCCAHSLCALSPSPRILFCQRVGCCWCTRVPASGDPTTTSPAIRPLLPRSLAAAQARCLGAARLPGRRGDEHPARRALLWLQAGVPLFSRRGRATRPQQ